MISYIVIDYYIGLRLSMSVVADVIFSIEHLASGLSLKDRIKYSSRSYFSLKKRS